MKQNAIRTIFFLVCCLLVVLSPSHAATVKRAIGDVGYAVFTATTALPVSGTVTFYQLTATDTLIYGQFNTGVTKFPPCKLIVETGGAGTDLTSNIAGTTNQAFQFTLPNKILQTFKDKNLDVICGALVGSAPITVIP
ncbi:8498_t:CDS:1 [Paraglomus brasilianum]|uniref:8498_t:CDS:1 n=1 Tax=Paraglomus brasilianum TaxID=144538 RepID=A0A9N9D7T7_9GLOM|nr:8498_t:CDS:1 [Paraglomus brasilianum]